MRTIYKGVLVSLLAPSLLGLGLSSSESAQRFPSRPPLALPTAYRHVEAQSLLPRLDTVDDLVTYGQQLVRIRIQSESRIAMSADEQRDEYGIVVRKLTYNVVDTLWSRPGAPALPATGETNGNGWIYDHGEMTAIKASDSPWLSVGHEYLVMFSAITLPPDLAPTNPGPIWSPISAESIVSADDGVYGKGEPLTAGSAARRQLTGLTRAEIVETIKRAKPNPAARPLAGINPALPTS